MSATTHKLQLLRVVGTPIVDNRPSKARNATCTQRAGRHPTFMKATRLSMLSDGMEL